MAIVNQVAAIVATAAASWSLSAEETEASSGSKGRDPFLWGGTFSAIFLLILNRVWHQSSRQTSLLVVYLFISFPAVLFKILRGQFGCWVAFLAVAANLFFPHVFPASRFLLFVVTPDWVADGLRDSIVGGVFCLIIGVALVIEEIRGIGGCRNCECNALCFLYCFGIFFLFFFTILYMGLGSW